MKRKITLLIVCLLFSVSNLLAANATAISVVGKAWYRSDAKAGWKQLKRGGKVNEGGWVKTEAGAVVRLVSPKGGIVRVAEKQEKQLGGSGSSKQDGRLFAVLDEVFSADKRARMAASRAGVEEEGTISEATQKRLEEIYRMTWVELMNKPKLSGEDLELAFDTAAWYNKRPVQNRALGLLIRLREDFPEHEGVKAFADNALASYGNPAKINFLAKRGNKSGPMKQGDTLKQGDGVQVRFESETESFLYLFLHTEAKDGKTDTAKIFPPANVPQWSIKAGEKLELPMEGAHYILDDTVGKESIWIWSCAGSLSEEMVQSAMQKVLQTKAAKKKITPALLKQSAPDLCTQSFVMDFHHR